MDNVRWRLCLIALANVVDKFEGVYPTNSLVEQVTNIVDPKRVRTGEEGIAKWLQPLLRAASKYRLLTEELGIGELCCLPPDTGNTMYA